MFNKVHNRPVVFSLWNLAELNLLRYPPRTAQQRPSLTAGRSRERAWNSGRRCDWRRGPGVHGRAQDSLAHPPPPSSRARWSPDRSSAAQSRCHGRPCDPEEEEEEEEENDEEEVDAHTVPATGLFSEKGTEWHATHLLQHQDLVSWLQILQLVGDQDARLLPEQAANAPDQQKRSIHLTNNGHFRNDCTLMPAVKTH